MKRVVLAIGILATNEKNDDARWYTRNARHLVFFSFFFLLLPLFSFLSTAIEVGNKTRIRVEPLMVLYVLEIRVSSFSATVTSRQRWSSFRGTTNVLPFPPFIPYLPAFLFRFSHAEYTGNGSVTCLPNRWHLFFSPSGFTRKWDFPLDFFFVPSLKTFLFEARRIRRLTSRIKHL